MRKVKDIMEEAPTIGLEDTITEAARLLFESHVPIVTVVSEKGKLIGIVTEWDITKG